MKAINRDSVKELVQALVRIPSVVVSSGETKSNDGVHGERRLAEYVAARLIESGLNVEMEAPSPERPVVWGRLDAGCEHTLLLEAHLDTVEADPDDPAPFDAEERDGAIWGRGACDCKASMAAFMEVARRLAAEPERAAYNVIVAAACDEEYTMMGSSYLADRLRGEFDFAICGEPTRLRPITTHKGVARWKVKVLGRGAHSSEPKTGDNAVYRAAALIRAIEEYCDRLTATETDPDLKSPTICVTGAFGGTAMNIVPPECELWIDRRLMPGESRETAQEEFKAVLEAALAPAHWRLEVVPLFAEPLERHEDNEYFRRFQDTLKNVGAPHESGILHGGTDAPNFAATGAPTIVWGPGDLAHAHTRHERVAIDEVRLAADALLKFLSKQPDDAKSA